MSGERIDSSASGTTPGGRGEDRRSVDAGWFLGAAVAAAVALAVAMISDVLAIAVVLGLAASTMYLARRVRGLEALRDRGDVSGTWRLHEEIERARRLDYPFALMRLDRTPHADPEVDAAIQADIRSTLRITDTIIRDGRDTFLVLPHVDDADTIRHRLSRACPQANGVFAASVVALFPNDGVTADGLLDVCNARTSSEQVPTSGLDGTRS